jgi:hypothetical protein
VDIDFSGSVAVIDDLQPGTFFITRNNELTTLGISAIFGHDKAAVVLNHGFKPNEHFPCIVMSHYFGGAGLIALPTIFLLPSLSIDGLQFSSTHQDGPGALTISGDKVIMRVIRRAESFFYLDVKSGVLSTSIPSGIEIPRWSIRLPGRSNSLTTLYDFAGAKPLS